ncbi:hypothetical protein ALQ90_05702 [Pseudomonas savastanoi pv. savastanoi]|nr:hypothetical protein ALQ90_05702 [Pseudomonas savastanoi pv. savastanoi]
MRNDNLDYRAALCVACSSGRSASGLERAARRRFVTRSVTQSIPTLEREERSPHYRAALCVACSSGRSASDLEQAERHRFVTRSVTQGIPKLEREER